jgi:hypothetical protein
MTDSFRDKSVTFQIQPIREHVHFKGHAYWQPHCYRLCADRPRGRSLLPQHPMTLTNHINEPTNNSKTASDASFVTSLSRLQSAADMPPSVSAASNITCRPLTVLGSALRKREPSAFDEPTARLDISSIEQLS